MADAFICFKKTGRFYDLGISFVRKVQYTIFVGDMCTAQTGCLLLWLTMKTDQSRQERKFLGGFILINNKIEPFDFSCMEDGIATVCLNEGEYRTDFFQKYDDFETYYGCGYDWELFAESYVRKCFPEMTKDIESDSESGMFCIYSEQIEVLEKFALELKRVTEDLSTMERVWLEIRKSHQVYVAMEYTSSNEMFLSYVGVTALPLEDRLKQHRMNGKNYKKLFLIDSFMDLNEARGYEEVIEELMTDPKHNKKHLFTNENNSVYPQKGDEFYEDITEWAVENMYDKGYMSSEGKLVILDSFYKNAETFEISELTGADVNGENQEHIFPFHTIKLESGMMSVFLDTSLYKKELFMKRTDEGIMGSGYDWEKVASILRQEADLDGEIYFDSESDLFCAYTDNSELLMKFVLKLKEACDNNEKLDAVIQLI